MGTKTKGHRERQATNYMKDKTIQIKRTKAYLVQVSRGDAVQIDQEELPKVVAAMQSGAPCVLKRGIINPSYVTSVVPDRERIEAWLHDSRYDNKLREGGMKPLAELIDRNEVLAQLGVPQQNRLGNGQ